MIAWIRGFSFGRGAKERYEDTLERGGISGFRRKEKKKKDEFLKTRYLKRGRNFQVRALWLFYSSSLLYHSSCILSGGFLALICYLGILLLCFLCHSLWAFTAKINLDTVRVMSSAMEPIYFGMKRVPIY